ncbi:MAG: efflux RND transporter periplasmic adaptor subunit [candidate division Zixibacteria bacterium]|nr:efflux RND transporter periplasmic adaptor subunit [candidate division Zixibacteria bacterium]
MVKVMKMKKLYILLLGILALIVSGCLQEEEKSVETDNSVAVVTEKVDQDDFPLTLKVGGTLQGENQSIILSKVISMVTEIPVRVGQSVRKGDLLVKLDPSSVQSQYHQAEAPFLNAEKQLKKMRALYAAGAISESQLDEVETQYKVARANFESARDAVVIVAPFDGMVVDIPVRIGDEINLGQAVVEIANVGALRLILDVPTSQVGQLSKGQTVRVTSPLEKGAQMAGEVMGVADAANRETRSFEVECWFDNPPQGFAPGVYVVAEVEITVLTDVLLVPNAALMYRAGKTQVYAVAADTIALIPVNIKAEGKTFTAIEGNLTMDQRVVVVGQKNLTPGTKVKEAGN